MAAVTAGVSAFKPAPRFATMKDDAIQRPGGVWEHENGDLTVPTRAESEDGSIIGDAMVRLTKGTPEWQGWHDYLGAEKTATE